MAALAKVVGQVNGEFFSELENLYFTPNPSCFAIASFGAAQNSLRIKANSKNKMKKLVFPICKQFDIKFRRSQTHYLNWPSAKNQYLNMKNIICCRVCIDNIHLHAQSQLNLVVEFVWISAPWQAPKHYYSKVHSLWVKGHQTHTFPEPNSNTCFWFWSGSTTAGSLSHSGYGGLEVPYPMPKDFTCRKTSLYSTMRSDSIGLKVKEAVKTGS